MVGNFKSDDSVTNCNRYTSSATVAHQMELVEDVVWCSGMCNVVFCDKKGNGCSVAA